MTFSINEDCLRNLVYLRSHHDSRTKQYIVYGLREGNQGDGLWFGCLRVTLIKPKPEGGNLVTDIRARGGSSLGF